jgi:hypothetical protein
MKRLIFVLLLVALATIVFADDALVLPKGVLRTYITGAYAFANQQWDKNGDKGDFPYFDSLNAVNLGGALEFGVIDWISAAVQWAPGWTVWSATKNGVVVIPLGGVDFANLLVNGPYNVFAGAKIQVVGPKAPVASEKVRLAAAAGVKIPVKAPDAAYWTEQYNKSTTGEKWVSSYNDQPLWGIGARGYFDYVLNKMFYFNLYSEFIYYLGTVKGTEYSVIDMLTYSTSELNVGYDLTLEAEPHFEMMLGKGVQLGAGLPVTFTMSPEVKVDGAADPDTDSYLLTIGPNVSFFLMKFYIPMEFKIGYTLPLVGKNAYATNTLVLQIKTYLRFYK